MTAGLRGGEVGGGEDQDQEQKEKVKEKERILQKEGRGKGKITKGNMGRNEITNKRADEGVKPGKQRACCACPGCGSAAR